MTKGKKIIAIIPARGGSKRIFRKNVKLIAGKPLIFYTIDAAFKSRRINRILVSTDDVKIAEVAKKYGAEIINRPKRLSGDRAKTIDVLLHAIEFLSKSNYRPDYIVLLQPTSPLRSSNDINKAIKLAARKAVNAVVSVYQKDPTVYWSFRIEKGYLKPALGRRYLSITSQRMPGMYVPNGSIYIISPRIAERYKTFYPPKTVPYIMSEERSIDIDDPEDFVLVERILKGASLDVNSKH